MTSDGGREPVSCQGAFPLTARLERWQRAFLRSGEAVRLIERFGSPVNLQSTEPFRRNLLNFKSTAEKRGLAFKPFFARKANKCLSYLDAAKETGSGIDTAGLIEVEQSLQRGVPASDIICTAAIKSEELLRLCVEQGVTIIIDNDDELHLLGRIARALGRHAVIGLRLAGFAHESGRLHSRFGFPIDHLSAVFDCCQEQYADALHLTGLHFHLNGYDAEHRISALRQVLPHAAHLKSETRSPVFIDIGGGIPMRYLEKTEQWGAWLEAHDEALLGLRDPLTKNNHGLGRIAHEGKLLGRIDAYPTGFELVQEGWLSWILDAPFDGTSIAEELFKGGIELRCEPGRSVLDGCGMTMAKVQFRKRDTEGNWVIGITMNRTQCRTGFAEFMLDPLLLPATVGRDATEVIDGFIAGTYCTESEWLSLRKLRFPSGVSVGDLLVFPNTAGYLMHFLESRSHQFELAKNIFVTDDGSFDTLVLDDIDEDRHQGAIEQGLAMTRPVRSGIDTRSVS